MLDAVRAEVRVKTELGRKKKKLKLVRKRMDRVSNERAGRGEIR